MKIQDRKLLLTYFQLSKYSKWSVLQSKALFSNLCYVHHWYRGNHARYHPTHQEQYIQFLVQGHLDNSCGTGGDSVTSFCLQTDILYCKHINP